MSGLRVVASIKPELPVATPERASKPRETGAHE
jgi:hypothetical protein